MFKHENMHYMPYNPPPSITPTYGNGWCYFRELKLGFREIACILQCQFNSDCMLRFKSSCMITLLYHLCNSLCPKQPQNHVRVQGININNKVRVYFNYGWFQKSICLITLITFTDVITPSYAPFIWKNIQFLNWEI